MHLTNYLFLCNNKQFRSRAVFLGLVHFDIVSRRRKKKGLCVAEQLWCICDPHSVFELRKKPLHGGQKPN